MTVEPFPLRRWSFGATQDPAMQINPSPHRRTVRDHGICRGCDRISWWPGRFGRSGPGRRLRAVLTTPAKITAIRETIEETAVIPALRQKSAIPPWVVNSNEPFSRDPIFAATADEIPAGAGP